VEWFQWWNTFLASVKPWVQTPVFEKKKKERKKERKDSVGVASGKPGLARP
jgi:hypothetical protein